MGELSTHLTSARAAGRNGSVARQIIGRVPVSHQYGLHEMLVQKTLIREDPASWTEKRG